MDTKFHDLAGFLDKLPGCASSQEVGVLFAAFAGAYGFRATACGESREFPDGRRWKFFFNTWPEDWLLTYQKNDHVRHDPLPAMARVLWRPFTWREVMGMRESTPEQIALYEWIKTLGIHDAFAVPIHYPGDDFGLCVSAGDHFVESSFERHAMHMASLYAHQRCCELGGQSDASKVPTPLTMRELDCLRWVLKGKSDTDIAEILGISHTTVHFHVERTKKKLGVKTRAQAATIAMSLGYL
jgi:DNA-binding CsgD family transcriptional regulator